MKLALEKGNRPSVATPADVFIGGDCYFLGYPYGSGYTINFQGATRGVYMMPFVKRCTLSGVVHQGDTAIWILDGLNNEGFSGGPVVFRDAHGRFNAVGAVVSGYRRECINVNSPDGSAHGTVDINTGLVVSYEIAQVIEAIRRAKKQPAPSLR